MVSLEDRILKLVEDSNGGMFKEQVDYKDESRQYAHTAKWTSKNVYQVK